VDKKYLSLCIVTKIEIEQWNTSKPRMLFAYEWSGGRNDGGRYIANGLGLAMKPLTGS
jgi:hypothetical protein